MPFGAFAGETISVILMGEVIVDWSVDDSLTYWCNERKIPVKPLPRQHTHKSFNDNLQPKFYCGAFILRDLVMSMMGIVRMLHEDLGLDLGFRV